MDTAALALKLRRLNSWIELHEERATLEVHRLATGPYGRAEITIDATATSPAASLNRNRIYLCGVGNGLTQSGLQTLVAEFEFRHIERCFVWLSPGPDMDIVRGWLSALGFSRVTWTRYPTLLHSSAAPQSQFSALEIRQVSIDEIALARPLLGEAMMEGYCKTAGKQASITIWPMTTGSRSPLPLSWCSRASAISRTQGRLHRLAGAARRPH